MKKLLLVGALIVIATVFFLAGKSSPVANEATAAVVAGGDYDAVLRFENYEYVLDPPQLPAGKKVRIKVDTGTVYGCMRDVMIPGFGVRKVVNNGDDIIEFTPDKTGTFQITCSMNMGRGSFEVV